MATSLGLIERCSLDCFTKAWMEFPSLVRESQCNCKLIQSEMSVKLRTYFTREKFKHCVPYEDPEFSFVTQLNIFSSSKAAAYSEVGR